MNVYIKRRGSTPHIFSVFLAGIILVFDIVIVIRQIEIASVNVNAFINSDFILLRLHLVNLLNDLCDIFLLYFSSLSCCKCDGSGRGRFFHLLCRGILSTVISLGAILVPVYFVNFRHLLLLLRFIQSLIRSTTVLVELKCFNWLVP